MRRKTITHSKPAPQAPVIRDYPRGFSFTLDGHVYAVERVYPSGRVDYSFDGKTGFVRHGSSFANLVRLSGGVA